MSVRTLLEDFLEFNYLKAYSWEELQKRVRIFFNEKGYTLERYMLDNVVVDWNENEENHTVAIYIE